MSESPGFRVTVFFNLFFTDQKSRSSVYVNINRCKTVQGLKEHISKLFNVPHGDFDLHCANNFLPAEEDIRVLKADDTVLIVPNKWKTTRKRKSSPKLVEHEVVDIEELSECSLDNSPEELQKIVRNSKKKRKHSIDLIESKITNMKSEYSSTTPKKAKIDKKSKRKESLIESEIIELNKPKEKTKKVVTLDVSKECEELESSEINSNRCSTIEKITFFEHLTHSTESNSEKAKDSMRKCSLPKCNSYNNIEIIQSDVIKEASPLKATPIFVSNRRTRTSTPYYQPIGTLLKELKNTSSKVEEECSPQNDGKKRKRYRKRKPRPNSVQLNAENNSESPFEPQPMLQPTQITQRTHIKFSEDVEIIPDDTIDAADVGATDNGGTSTDSAIEVIEVIEVASSGGSVDAAAPIEKTLQPNMTMSSIMTSPSMKNIPPKAGDLIAFKMLRLTESYTPELSKYITAKTINYDLLSRSISLQIIEGGEQMKLPNGKFSLDMLEEIEQKGQLSEEMTINWDQLIDPRLLYP